METIYAYTKQDAVEDGEQVDISNMAEVKEAGFTRPVYITRSVYNLYEVPKGLEGYQDFKGRLWDTVYMAALQFKEAKQLGKDCKIIPFKVIFQTTTKQQKTVDIVELWLVFNEQGFTILRPEEY